MKIIIRCSFVTVIKYNVCYDKTYKYLVKIEYPIENVATCLVKMTCSYYVPMSDPVQSFKLNHPCKDFEHIITVKNDNWEIMADAVAFLICNL